MSKGISNMSRTLRYIREQGWMADIVERFNPYAGKFGQRKDLFSIFDIIALGDKGIIGIQSCGQNFAEHNRKMLENEVAPEWLKAGGSIMLICWRKLKLKRGGKAMRWMPRIKEYAIDDFVI